MLYHHTRLWKAVTMCTILVFWHVPLPVWSPKIQIVCGLSQNAMANPKACHIKCRFCHCRMEVRGSCRRWLGLVVSGNLAVMRLLMIVVGADRYWWWWQMHRWIGMYSWAVLCCLRLTSERRHMCLTAVSSSPACNVAVFWEKLWLCELVVSVLFIT